MSNIITPVFSEIVISQPTLSPACYYMAKTIIREARRTGALCGPALLTGVEGSTLLLDRTFMDRDATFGFDEQRMLDNALLLDKGVTSRSQNPIEFALDKEIPAVVIHELDMFANPQNPGNEHWELLPGVTMDEAVACVVYMPSTESIAEGIATQYDIPIL